MSRSTKDLHPKVAELAHALIVRASENGTPIIITQTLRTKEEQDALYAQGRTKPGKIVTKAKGGESYHNYGLAFDVALVVGKRIVWDKNDLNKNNKDDWQEIGELGESVGLEWGGRWKFKDVPHFQKTFGLTIADLKSGRTP
jgi:peptidoglycan L-alanyl-D-glutamate endopeptidase CwlK